MERRSGVGVGEDLVGKRTKSVARWVALGWTCGVEESKKTVGTRQNKSGRGPGDPVTGPKTQEKEIVRRRGLNTPKEKLDIGRGRRGLNTCRKRKA